MTKQRRRESDVEFARMYNRKQHDLFFQLLKEYGLIMHVVVTVPERDGDDSGNWRLVSLTKWVQLYADRNSVGFFIGAGEQIEGGAPHVHLFMTRRDARRLQRVWQASGFGIVMIHRRDADEKHYMNSARYVQTKWMYDDGTPGNMVIGGHANTSRVA